MGITFRGWSSLQVTITKVSVWIAACCLLTGSRAEPAPNVQVVLGDVKDTRLSGKEAGKLEVQLKVSRSGMPADAKGCRIALTKAIDDVGTDLLGPQARTTDFKFAAVNMLFTLNLKNPDRKAGHIRELSGNVEVFVPNQDLVATLTIDWSRREAGNPIKSEVLKSAGVELTAWTADQFNAFLKKKEAEDLKDSEAKEREYIRTLQARAAQQPTPFDQQKAIANFKAAFAQGREMNAFARRNTMALKPNDVVFSIKDPNVKLVGFEFRDSLNNTIKSTGTSEYYQQDGSKIERERTYHFDAPVPATGKLLVLVATPQSLLKVPFTLGDISLP